MGQAALVLDQAAAVFGEPGVYGGSRAVGAAAAAVAGVRAGEHVHAAANGVSRALIAAELSIFRHAYITVVWSRSSSSPMRGNDSP